MSAGAGFPSTTRRGLLVGTASLAAVSAFPFAGARAQAAPGARHGLSVFGDLKYGPSFQNFDYVDPAAPAGGRMAFTAPSWAYNQNPQTFNTFNTFILTGDAPPRMELCFDTLMVRALDEPDAVYGLVAETVEVSGDGNLYVFDLRREARFHDGSPLTAEDVAFSLTTLKDKGHPAIRQTLTEMAEAQVLTPHRVAVRFTGRQSRKTPLAVTGMPILSKAYYSRYDFEGTTLTPPLSSGPYKVARHEIGRFIEYQRVADWWAKDLPVSRGHFNFKTLRLEFYRNRTAGFEAFKKGTTTYREEFTSKTWATEYNFPAVEDGRVLREEIPDGRPSGGQGWFLNTRRPVFSDARVRQALGLVFDFEWTNKSLFFGAYQRTHSFFQNSPMFAEGEPSAEELTLLEPFRDELPEAVFGPAVLAPVSDGSGNDRTMLREADRLLREAGCRRDGTTLLTPDGAPFSFEILSNSPTFERVVLPYAKGLARLGIEASFRVVDPAQYQSRVNTYDFDVVSRRFPLSATLGEEIRQLWGSRAAETPGTTNLSGIRSPAVDALIDAALSAPSRERMIVAARALDRVLRAGYYWVPHWYKPVHTVAMWDLFARPGDPPAYDFRPELHWWVDPQKAERLGKGG
ncbi:extracellular solute-binding protein [Stappia sp. ES.058]|uniref:extracellular solute-binding protein n=1 Tax=Stappia sp. ES.058 TaxID=1881061 RepID=UPI00087D3EAE|nr:extracellular solute-binding protein [Stappia sp. ES.058]SDU46746.1 microcin C transport system substrate-binding protein [Stappia sp. ES.058]